MTSSCPPVPPLNYTLGPFYKRTHWKQTVFYLNKPVRGKKGDTYKGRIAVKKSEENPRALNIKIGTSGQNGD